MPPPPGSGASSSTGIRADAALQNFGKRLVSAGPKIGTKYEDLAFEYLKGGGKISADPGLKLYAKARVAVQELTEQENPRPEPQQQPEPESEASASATTAKEPGSTAASHADTFTPIKSAASLKGKTVLAAMKEEQTWAEQLKTFKCKYPRSVTSVLIVLASAALADQLQNLGETLGALCCDGVIQLASGLRSFAAGFFGAFKVKSHSDSNISEVMNAAKKEGHSVHINMPASEPSALAKVKDFIDRLFTASIGAVCMYIFKRNHA